MHKHILTCLTYTWNFTGGNCERSDDACNSPNMYVSFLINLFVAEPEGPTQ
jgi:hypothetical protein